MPRTGPICSYCESASILVDACAVYGPAYEGRFVVWTCGNYPTCDAFVGVFQNSHDGAPVGTLANAELRDLRTRLRKILSEKSAGMTKKAKKNFWPIKQIGYMDETECRARLMALIENKERETNGSTEDHV